MPEISRKEILKRLRAKVAAGKPIIGGGAGTGISAKCEEAGGIDLIVIYNSGRFRMAGHGSMAGLWAYSDANAVVVDMAREVLPVVKKTPVLAGVNGTDPMRIMPLFLRQIKEMGFSGVQNFPTIGLTDGIFRINMEETGFGYDKEVAMIAEAHKLDLFTSPYVFNAAESAAMARAGADMIVAHMGCTLGGSIGAATTKTLDESVELCGQIRDAARKVRKDILLICHGGPIAEPEDAAYILKHCKGIHGFYGASSMERLPTERALTEQTRRFCSLKIG